MLKLIQNISVKAKLNLLVGLFTIGFAVFGTVSFIMMSTVKVNGPLYQEIVLGKDLTADILPPPEYIIESYLVVQQVIEALEEKADKGALDALIEKGRTLRTEFDTRHQHWNKELGDGLMKETLLVKSYKPAIEFFDLRDKEFIPAVNVGDLEKAKAVARGTMKKKYNEHRAAIDDVVKMATAKIAQDEQSTKEIVQRDVVIQVGLGVGLVAIVFFLSWFIARCITKPLTQAVAVLKDIAEGEGDLTKRLDVLGRDEIGDLAKWFNVFMDKLHGIIGQVRGAVGEITEASQQLSSASDQLSSGAQEQASSLEQTAASLEQITGTVKQTADNSRQANQLAAGARDLADHGGQVVGNAVEAVGEINKSSKKIADIITTIDEIAFQTNLLALNAAVEAARAGEQGRGFAVVASEVRNLAQRSATAAKEIKSLIQDSVQKVEVGSDMVAKSGKTLEEIVGSVKRVTDIIAEIAAASSEQSSGIDQINRAVSQMDQVTQSNAAQTEELSSTAQNLTVQAEQLQELVGSFKLGNDGSAITRLPATAGVQPTLPSSPARSVKRAGSSRAQEVSQADAFTVVSAPNGKAVHGDSAFEEF